MSKVLYICSRNESLGDCTKQKLNRICDHLVPDNVSGDPKHRVNVERNLAYSVSMDSGVLRVHGMSLLLGLLFEQRESNWQELGSGCPDGNYAIFRVDDDELEIVTDCAGTRSVWYYHDNELFIASTSQRAIVMYLGEFSFDREVIPWILSTGCLGPENSWDKRIKRLQVDSELSLDRTTWKLSVDSNPILFSEVKRTPEEHKNLLTNAISKSIASLRDIDFERWLLPLSGGFDSRGILCFMNEVLGVPEKLRSVTWGEKESIFEDGNDAKIANDVASFYAVPHSFYHSNVSQEPFESIVNRFLFCSEGRIDHIAGYMDGMVIWKRFYEEGVTGLIRGDEGFGWENVSSESGVRISAGCGQCDDFGNLAGFVEKYDFPSQKMPRELERCQGETLDAWRDRLYHSYRMPAILAALSDIKFSYVEQINPFLSKCILNVVRTLPDSLRTEKAAFRSIIDSIGPKIPYASKDANAPLKNILKQKNAVDFLRSEIGKRDSVDLLGPAFVESILKGIREVSISANQNRKISLKSKITRILPKRLKSLIRRTVAKPVVDGNVLAFRVLTIIRMHQMLTSDSTTCRD